MYFFQTVQMAHALRRISYATCDPEHCIFSFIAREPKGHFNKQFCHSFLSVSGEQVSIVFVKFNLKRLLSLEFFSIILATISYYFLLRPQIIVVWSYTKISSKLVIIIVLSIWLFKFWEVFIKKKLYTRTTLELLRYNKSATNVIIKISQLYCGSSDTRLNIRSYGIGTSELPCYDLLRF